MRTITLTAFNRPDYLKATLGSLRENAIQDFTLFIGVEPGCDEVMDIVNAIDFIDTRIYRNDKIKGILENPFATLSRAFSAGSVFNVALEDDLLLSPDAFDLANWYYERLSQTHLCLGLMNYDSDPALPNTIVRTRHFTPLGWATAREYWFSYFVEWWRRDARGWDFSISSLLDSTAGLYTAHPRLARSNHIGRERGTFCTIEYHDKRFAHLPYSDGRCRKYYLES